MKPLSGSPNPCWSCSGWSGKILAETAQARKSAVYMAMGPGADLGCVLFRRSGETRRSCSPGCLGQVLLAAAIVLNIIAVWLGACNPQPRYLTMMLFAQIPSDIGLQWTGSIVIGLAVAVGILVDHSGFWQAKTSSRASSGVTTSGRINELRRTDVFLSAVSDGDPVAWAGESQSFLQKACRPSNARSRRLGCRDSGCPRNILGKNPTDFLVPDARVCVCVFFIWFGENGLVPAVMAVILTTWLLRRRLAGRAQSRLRQIKRRMPFLLDLLTLLMQAGSTFINRHCGRPSRNSRAIQLPRSSAGVLADMNMGKTRSEALRWPCVNV